MFLGLITSGHVCWFVLQTHCAFHGFALRTSKIEVDRIATILEDVLQTANAAKESKDKPLIFLPLP